LRHCEYQRKKRKNIIKELLLLDEAWFRIKIIGVFKDTYKRIDTAVHGHSAAWDMFKRRLLTVWQDESSTRRTKNMARVKICERMYAKYLRRLKHPNGRPPVRPRIGQLLKDALKEAKEKLKAEKRRKQQELSTKEFLRNTKYHTECSGLRNYRGYPGLEFSGLQEWKSKRY
jgi:hypothetical protein